MNRLSIPISTPIREGLTISDKWHREDRGLIYCWERGRETRLTNPDLAKRAEQGELMVLNWRGGVERKLKLEIKRDGTLWYLATWQGLRNDDLNIDLKNPILLTCSKTGQSVEYQPIAS